MPETTTDVYFWLDFETTGLKVGEDAVLEIAWMFTDHDLKMLTPLRQRLTCLQPAPYNSGRYSSGPRSGGNFDPSKPAHWNTPAYFDSFEVVSRMHAQSGLKDDHLNAIPESVLTHPRDFERLYLDDLVSVKTHYADDVEIGNIVLSGAGVSHFDCHVLADLWPKRFPVLPPQDNPLAYWYFDTSVAARMMPPYLLERAREWARKPESNFYLRCEAGEDIANGPHACVRREDNGAHVFDLDGIEPHRAADDLVASLVDARLMRDIENIVLTSRSDVG